MNTKTKLTKKQKTELECACDSVKYGEYTEYLKGGYSWLMYALTSRLAGILSGSELPYTAVYDMAEEIADKLWKAYAQNNIKEETA